MASSNRHSFNKHIILEVVTLTTLLFALSALPILGLKEGWTSIRSHGRIDYGVNTRVGQFENGTYYVEVVYDDGTSEMVYKSADADEVINHAISISFGGSVFVTYTGKDYEIDDTIHMMAYVTLLLDNNVRIKQTVGKIILTFVGTESEHLINAHVNSLGQAILYGSGSGGNGGIFMQYADNCSIRNIEVTNAGSYLINLRMSDDNILENVYGHKFSVSGSASHGVKLDSSARNKLLNCTIDAEQQPTSRSCLLIICNYPKDGMYNEIIGGEYRNSAEDNGIYLCSAGESTVDYTTIKDVRLSGNQDPGHSGLKLRPASYCTITGVISENNYNGMEMGTHMNPEWREQTSSNHNYIQGNFSNNLKDGVIMWIDHHDYTISNNEFSIITNGNGLHGLVITTATWSNAEIKYNEVNIESRNNAQSGVWMEENGGSYVERNNVTGISENNVDYGVRIQGPDCIDNRFDVLAANNTWGDISDSGIRTRINGVGREAAGVGNPPTASLWDVDDIVINTDDDTSWTKDASGTMKPLTQLTARFTPFMAINSTVVQFIDQSYDPDGNIVAWNWDFGDGLTSNEQNPKHEYSLAGNYVVSLTVTDDDDNTDNITIEVSVSSA